MEVSDEFIEKNIWMVRSCRLYDDEYSNCTAIRSRIHQQFINAKFDDCGPWKRDYNNCYLWTEKQDRKAFKELIESELERRSDRLTAHNGNDIWEKRSEPPANWNSPLPAHIEERIKNSYLALKSQELKDKTVGVEKSLCVIS